MPDPEDLETRLRSLSIDRASDHASAASAPPSAATTRRRSAGGRRIWIWSCAAGLLAAGGALVLSPPLKDRAMELAAPVLTRADAILDTTIAPEATQSAAQPATQATYQTTEQTTAQSTNPSATGADPLPSASSPQMASGPRIIGSGFVVAPTSVTLMSEIGGRVARVEVAIGDRLEAGSPVLRLDDSDARLTLGLAREDMRLAQARLDSARAEHAAAAAPLQRLETLDARGVGRRAALEDARLQLASLAHGIAIARSQLETARLTLQRAERDLDKHVLRAPFDAVVVDLPAAPGMTVSSGTSGGADEAGLMQLMDIRQLYVDVDVAERNIAAIRREQLAEIRLDAFPDRSLGAQVVAIDPRASREKATIRVRLKLDATDLAGVRPNMSAKATFTNLSDRALAQLQINGSN